MQVSIRSTETSKQTPIKNKTLRVFEKVILIDFKLGVRIVDIMREDTNRTHITTRRAVIPSKAGKENLLLKKSIPNGINNKYAPAGAGTP